MSKYLHYNICNVCVIQHGQHNYIAVYRYGKHVDILTHFYVQHQHVDVATYQPVNV